jgi:hypothetical protein
MCSQSWPECMRFWALLTKWKRAPYVQNQSVFVLPGIWALNRLTDFHKIMYRNFVYKIWFASVRCVSIGSVSHTALQGVDKFPPYFRCCVYRPIWVKSGVKDLLHTLPFGTCEFRGNRHNEGRTFAGCKWNWTDTCTVTQCDSENRR